MYARACEGRCVWEVAALRPVGRHARAVRRSSRAGWGLKTARARKNARQRDEEDAAACDGSGRGAGL